MEYKLLEQELNEPIAVIEQRWLNRPVLNKDLETIMELINKQLILQSERIDELEQRITELEMDKQSWESCEYGKNYRCTYFDKGTDNSICRECTNYCRR